jgi:voltage-gated potassium channel
MPRKFGQSIAQLRRRLYDILEHGTIVERTGRFVGRFIVSLIILNLIVVTLESVPEYQARYQVFFTIIELVSLVVFTVEYALRVWVASEHTPHRHLSAAGASWTYVRSAFGIIDLLAVLPFWFAFALPPDFRVRNAAADSKVLTSCFAAFSRKASEWRAASSSSIT